MKIVGVIDSDTAGLTAYFISASTVASKELIDIFDIISNLPICKLFQV